MIERLSKDYYLFKISWDKKKTIIISEAFKALYIAID